MQKTLQHHFVRYNETSAYWDNLSKIWLTKRALVEFNRRNTLSRSTSRPARRSITRNFQAQQKNGKFLSPCTPGRLKNIKRFARRGGPDLFDLIGYPEPSHPLDYAMSSSRSNSYRKGSSLSASKTRTSGKPISGKTLHTTRSAPFSANFQQNLVEGGFYPYGFEYPDGSVPPLPDDWKETSQRLAQPRPSLSPSTFPKEKHHIFVRMDARAFNEEDVKGEVLPAMLDAMGAAGGAQKNILFTNIEPLRNDNTQAKPDYYYGARPEQIHSTVRKNLSKHIIPSHHADRPIVPNFFLEAKGPDGSNAVVRRQACHNGAIGARAMQSLHSYEQEPPVYDNNIYTISSTYHAGILKIYGHSVAQPNGPGTRPEYHMHQLKACAMTDDKETFLKGATVFKNAMELTREYRNAAIARANEIAVRKINDEEDVADAEEEEQDKRDNEAEAESSSMMLSVACSTSQNSTPAEDADKDADGSETSMDELAIDYMPPPAKRSSSKSHQSQWQQCKTGQTYTR